MSVNSIAASGYFSYLDLVQNKQNKNDRFVPSSARTLREDAYIPSGSSPLRDLSGVKARDLNEIKNRISSGFYDSVAVADDLTEAFSGIFRKTLPAPA